MNHARRRVPAAGFTLIELLVSVTIISMLIALLLPALRSARETARAAICLSNQRQMVMGLLGYTDASDGSFVPMEQRFGGDRLHWFGFEPAGGGLTNRALDPQRSPLADYLSGNIHEALACPAFPAEDPRFVAKFQKRSAHYGYNARLAPLYIQVLLGKARTRAIHEVAQASRVVAFADGVFADGLARVNGEVAFYEPHYMLPAFGAKYGGFGHFRHGQRANAVFVDGHAEPREPAAPPKQKIAGHDAGDLDDQTGPHSLYGF